MCYFRCLFVLALAFALKAPAQTNLLTTNPSFESGGPYHGWGQQLGAEYSFSGWTAHKHQWSFNRSQGVLSGDGSDGTRCFDAESAGWLRTASGARPAVTPGRVYEARFSAKKTAVRTSSWAGIVPRVEFYDAASNLVKRVYGPEALGANAATGWQEFAFRAIAPESAARAGLYFDFEYQATDPNTDANPAASFRLDHVRLAEVAQTDGVAFRRAPMFLEAGGVSHVVLKHRAPAPRDLLLRLTLGEESLGELRTAVAAGRGVVTNVFVTPTNAPRANTYAWEARLVEPGADWASALAAKSVGGVFLDSTAVVEISFPATHTNLVLEGRWTAPSAGSSRRQALWQGSSLHARFEGTSFKMRYDYSSFDAAHRLRLWVVVDGDETTRRSVVFNQGADALGTLASGLSNGVHTITVMREGEEAQGVWVLRRVELDAGRGLLRHAPFMDRRIEFYGDSTASGGDGGMWVNYTKGTARGLGAASSVVSKGATGVSGGFVFHYNALWYWDRATFDIFYGQSGYARNPYAVAPAPDPTQARGAAWGPGNFNAYGDTTSLAELPNKGGFANWQADVVVIGYGQNDQFGSGPWESNYRQFVILLRKVYPRAHIVCTHTSMTGDQNYFQRAIEPLLNDRGPGGVNADGKVHMLLLRPSGLGSHPPPQDHYDMAHGNNNWRGLIDFVEEVAGWGLDCPAGTPAELRGAQRAPGGLRFEVAGGEDCHYVVETSTNLTEWLPALTNRWRFPVTAPAAEPRRFFRAVYAGQGAEFFYATPVPATPGNFRATAVGSSYAALAWSDPNANELGLRLERRVSGGTFAPLLTLPPNTTNYLDAGLLENTTYIYRLRAFNYAGDGAWSPDVRVTTTNSVPPVVLAPAGATWRFLDSGVAPAADWTAPGFNDAAWGSGPAQLGYGDGDEATLVGFGGVATNKHITTWFRHTFTAAEPAALTNLTLRLLRDDGALVYLNGQEVFRSNLPAGAVSPTTLASATVDGANESAWFTQDVNPALLVAGPNVLAVEIHQANRTSSDISFDLSLEGRAR
jgi:hypothetical protein